MYGTSIALFVNIICFEGLIQSVDSEGKDKVELRLGSLMPRTAGGEFAISSNRTEEKLSTIQATWSNEAGCGVVTATTSKYFPRIVGGQDAERGQWPWVAMILRYYSSYSKFVFVCGGSVIKKQWVLTAGHCFFGGPAAYTHVVLGAHKKDMTDSSVRRFAIANYYCHHLFIGASNAFKDDICLIKLAGEVSYTNFIKPVCLPTNTQKTSRGEQCEIAGWGETQGTGSNAILQQAHVSILNQINCDQWYMDQGVTLPKDHFCAGYERGMVDSCQGDSGGPLTCKRTVQKKEINVLFGITSFGIGCAQEKLPGVYTDVATYTNWIASKIEKYSGPETCFDPSTLISCGSTIRDSETIVRTPVTDRSTWIYPSNLDCSWDIEAPVESTLRLTFECFFHVEINPKNSTECFDYMQIQSAGAGMLSVYCGSTLLNPVNIRSNKATISFHSDSSVESSGFVIKIQFIQQAKSKTAVVEEPENSSSSLNASTTVANSTSVTVNETKHPVINETENNNQVTSHKGCKSHCNSANTFSTSHLAWIIFICFIFCGSI